MRDAMRIAFALAVFLLVVGAVYYVSSQEWRGTVMLFVLALAVLYLGLVFRGALRRASPPATPEELTEEALAEAHVEPTIWPFVISIGAALLVLGAVVATWILILGVVALVGAGTGWFLDIKKQWHPGELHAAAGGREPASTLQGKEQPDEADRE